MLDLLTTKLIAINIFVCAFFTLFAYILRVLNYGNNGIFWKKYIFHINLIFQITHFGRIINNKLIPYVDTIDTVEGVCNGFLPYTRFLGFPEFSGYHQWQQESQ